MGHPQLLLNRHSTSLRFPFAYLANKRRKVAITPDYVNLRTEARCISRCGRFPVKLCVRLPAHPVWFWLLLGAPFLIWLVLWAIARSGKVSLKPLKPWLLPRTSKANG